MSKPDSTTITKSPKLTVPEIIDYCKNELGITFNLMDEEKAKEFLEKNNFFFRLKQYCSTCPEQTKSGKYIELDFGHLVELSTIDMFLRKLLLKMTIDLEHYLKVKLVNDCQNNPVDDGYEVVLITSPAASQHACITPLLTPLRRAASLITFSWVSAVYNSGIMM